MRTLEETPKKGKLIGIVGTIALKEIRYNKFRFHFGTDSHNVKFLKLEELTDLLIKFIQMSEKKDQENAIKNLIRNLHKKRYFNKP